jgi:purine nucleosidase
MLPGEAYALGDSPLVLATALQSFFEADTSSCRWRDLPCPRIDDEGLYVKNPSGRTIRVYEWIDNRMWLEDFYAKLEIHALNRS